MSKSIVMEEFHLTVLVSIGLRKADDKAIRRTLRSSAFHRAIRDAVRDAFRRFPSLKRTRSRITR